MPTAATYLGDEPTRKNLRMMRGDGPVTFTVTHTFGASSNIAEVRFFVRDEPDGNVIFQLTKTDDAAQIDLSVSNACTITINQEDTDGKATGKHWYDVEIEETAGAGGSTTTFQAGYFELEPDIANDFGGTYDETPLSLSEQLIAWTLTEAWYGTFTRDSDNVITTAAVTWPDGSAGTFTTTTKNTTYLAVDAFTVTHTRSGLTVTQTAVTRNSDGAVTTRPAPTVA